MPMCLKWLFLILLSPSVVFAGSIYKWVDEGGNVHFGDAPPPQALTETLDVKPATQSQGSGIKPKLRPGERQLLLKGDKREKRWRKKRDSATKAWFREQAEREKSCKSSARRMKDIERLDTPYARRERDELLRQRRKLYCFGSQ